MFPSFLPPEVLLNILSHCPIQTITKARIISKEWRALIDDNEGTIYHAAAQLHQFIKPGQPLESVNENYPGRWLDGLKGWKDFCQRWFQVERNWDGQGKISKEKLLQATGVDVHRFKVDERPEARFVITTHRRGGLRVVCMDSDELLFGLPQGYVRGYAHNEYGKGYLVFDRYIPHALEIWRLESVDWEGEGKHPRSDHEPDSRMQHIIRLATGTVDGAETTDPTPSLTSYPRRGVFAPWALFTPPTHPRAYRFVYPTLLVGSEEGRVLYFFDVPSARLVQTIPLPFLPEAGDAPFGTMMTYVELGPQHAFVCTRNSVFIIPRDYDGARNVQIEFPVMDPSMRIPQLIRQYAARLEVDYPVQSPSDEGMMKLHVVNPNVPEQSTALVPLSGREHEFTAAPSGKDFVAVTRLGIAYFVRDFEKVFRGEENFSNITLRIDLGSPALNLSYEYDRVVITTSQRIYVISLHTFPYPVHTASLPSKYTPPEPNPFKGLVVHALTHFNNSQALAGVSCLKHTKTGIWLNWSKRAVGEYALRHIARARFAAAVSLSDEEESDEEDEEFEADGVWIDQEILGPVGYRDRYVCHIDFGLNDRS